MWKKVLFAVLALALLLGAAALAEEPEVFTSGDFQYILLEDGTAEITKYSGKDVELVIPETLDGYRVSSVPSSSTSSGYGS